MPPPLSETFTSPRNGISIDYPAGWRTRPATRAVDDAAWPNFEDPTGDLMYDAPLNDHLFILLASQPLAGKTGDQWAADTLAADECAQTEPVTIDGASGLVGVECNVAAVASDGRGYLVVLYTSVDEPWLGEVVRPGLVRAAPDDDRPPPGGRRRARRRRPPSSSGRSPLLGVHDRGRPTGLASLDGEASLFRAQLNVWTSSLNRYP